MPAKRTTMRKIREVLRLRLEAGLSIRQISASTKSSVGAVQKLLVRAEQLNLTWPLSDDLDEPALARLFFPKADAQSSTRFQEPDWHNVRAELSHKGVTQLLLWEEYTAEYPNRCYSYAQYCARFKQWLQRQRRSMRQIHKAGEKCFIDYSGLTQPVVDGRTGAVRYAEVFVAVLGASSHTYAEATWSQSLPDWLQSHVRAFEFFGGVPELLVPDNLRSGVSKACRYDPELNPSYHQLAEHYQVVVMPARPYKPKDKSKAEVGVQVVERWILGRLRRQTFFSLGELNQAIRVLLDDLNSRPFKARPGSRRSQFEALDKPALRPLPTHPYRYVDIKRVRVNIDYHVAYREHLYSVPHQYVGEQLELHASEHTVTLYFRLQPVASHPRQDGYGMTTQASHMPERHRKQGEWTPKRFRHWAGNIGPDAELWVDARLNEPTHPEQAYRVCLGLLRLSRDFPPERLNDSCRLANREGLNRLKQIRAILASNRDQLQQSLPLSGYELPQQHANIRGPKDFH